MKGNDNWGDVLCVGLLFMQPSCCILDQLKQALKKLSNSTLLSVKGLILAEFLK